MHKLTLIVTAASIFAAPAGAATIISENFELGFGVFTPSGQVGISTGADYVVCCGATGTASNMANHFASFGSGDLPSGSLSTTFNTVAGQLYTISLDLGWLGSTIDPLTIHVGGAAGFDASINVSEPTPNNLNNIYAHPTFDFLGTGLATSLTINSFGASGGDAILDNFVLSTMAPVPEPATWAMMLVGFGGIGFAIRRRQTEVRPLRTA